MKWLEQFDKISAVESTVAHNLESRRQAQCKTVTDFLEDIRDGSPGHVRLTQRDK